jgi:cysteine dioxygenase
VFADKIGLHRVENKSHSKKAVSLHVYCPPILECERFDERTSKHSRVGNMTFFSVNGQKLSISEPARNFSS